MNNLSLDHIGIVVRNIEKAREIYLDYLGCKIASEIIHVKSQKIYCQYLVQQSSGLRLQLIEPADNTSPSFNALVKGGGVNHLCFSVENLDEILQEAQEAGCRIIVPTFHGEGLNDRRASFIYHPGMGLVEITEK